MAVNTQTVSNANNTLARRRQTNAALQMRRQQEVYAKIPGIEDIGYQITALGVEFTMAKLAKYDDKAAEIKERMRLLEESRNDILVQNGFKADYLDPVYSCPVCRDKGFADGKMCICLKQEIVKQRQNMLTTLSPAPKTTFEQFSLDYYADVTDEKGINPRRQMNQILTYCQKYANGFGKGRKSILMLGNSGLGKTHLSCAIAGECLKKGFVVMYASSQSLFLQIENNRYDTQNILNDILSCDLFILDDLGTEYMTSHGLSVLYNIINTRMLNGTPCIFSSNLTSQKALTAKYGEKIVSRLLGSCDVLSFIGDDIRFKKR